MQNEYIVKVGNTTNISINGATAYRAITISELERLYSKHSNSVIIIEKLKEKEVERAKKFISSIDKSKVFIYCSDNEPVTCGLADELMLDIYLNQQDMINKIEQIGLEEKQDEIVEEQEEIVEEQAIIEEDVKIEQQVVEEKQDEIVEEQEIVEEDENLNNVTGSVDNTIDDIQDDKLVGEVGQLTDDIIGIVNNEINSAWQILKVELNNENSRLKEELQYKSEKIAELSSKIEELEVQATRVVELEAGISLKNGKITELEKNVAELSELKCKLEGAYNESERTVAELKITLSEYEERVKVIELSLTAKETELTEIKLKMADKEDEINNLKNSPLADELANMTVERDNFERRYNAVKERYDYIVNSIGTDKDGVEALIAKLNASNIVIETQKETNKRIAEENVALSKENANLIKNIESLNNDITVSKNKITALSNSMTDDLSTKMPKLDCDGSAIIYNIFGAGGVGTTTLACSLADELKNNNSKVVIIDLNLYAPKVHSLFGKQIKVNSTINMSSLDYIKENKVSKFIENDSNTVVQVHNNGLSRLDLITGFSARPNGSDVVGIDLDELIAYCSRVYQYIIIDNGTVGSSNIGDEIIRVVSEIATKNIIVSENEVNSVKGVVSRVSRAKVKAGSKTIMVINRACGRMDERVAAGLTKTSNFLMPYSDRIADEHLRYNLDKGTKAKLVKFMDKL